MFFLLTLLSAFALWSCEEDQDNPTPEIPETLTLHAVGVATGTPVKTQIEGIGLEVEGNAFVMDFYDKNTGERIGSLTDINVAAETFDDGSMKGENYSVFTFEEDNSTLVMHNFIDMTPIDNATLEATIQPENAEYNVIGGTGRFAGIKGGSTLDAILDMTEFANGTVGFDCVYGINLDL